jgi:hypothetical protein
MVRGSVLILGLGFLIGCGAKATTPASTETTTPASEPAPTSSWEPPPLPTDTPAIKNLGISAPDDKPWTTMSYDEKEWYMVGKVHPVMREVFQSLDHDKYEGMKFECAPCHGENAAAKKYKMPSDHLSPVPAAGTEDWKAMQSARIVKFMVQRVTPSMAALIGEKSGDPGSGEHFSCWGCHPKQ